MDQHIARIIDLVVPESQRILNMEVEQARALLKGNPEQIIGIVGSFALVARDVEKVYLARSLDRPMRYFLAKEPEGPMLVVAERMDEIRAFLEREGYGDQFHPTYTRMVPAHHVTRLRLIGCPDPNPTYQRFFDPPRATLPADLDALGERYVGALCQEIRSWLQAVPADEPVGVLFSGGIDSGLVLICLNEMLLQLGQSPARLKAFTLAVDGGGDDAEQALEFLRRTGLEMLGEWMEISSEELDPYEAVRVIEDYKPLDVECATVTVALLRAIRRRYPSWNLVVEGDGGDENLKDYPIEENPELTIRSVVNNSMLYQEGWGVHSIKHSLTYSGGYSRACVRTYAPIRHFGFTGFSPFTSPSVVAVAEAMPFAELTNGSTEALYALKGEIARRGVRAVLNREMPVFAKRRFQHGAVSPEVFASRLSLPVDALRSYFMSLHQPG